MDAIERKILSQNFGRCSERSTNSLYKNSPSKISHRTGQYNTILLIEYTDKSGRPRKECLRGKCAYILLEFLKAGKYGLSQRNVVQGYILKDYVYLLTSCSKKGFFIPFLRENEPHVDGYHRRYYLDLNASKIKILT